MQDMFIYLHLSLPLNSINWLSNENQLYLPLIPPYPKYSQILSCGLGQKQGEGEQEDRNRCERRLQQRLRTIFRGNSKVLKANTDAEQREREIISKGGFFLHN